MLIRPTSCTLGSIGFVVAMAACAHDTYGEAGLTTTTGAALSTDAAVLEIGRARCERASECNILGSGRKYADRRQCMQAYVDEGGTSLNLNACDTGIDKKKLDKCIAVLRSELCEEDLGPVSGMPECDHSFCAH